MEKKMVSGSNRNWLNYINWQIDFYKRARSKPRSDPEFHWALVDSGAHIFGRLAKRALHMIGLHRDLLPLEWLNNNAESLWESRSLLNDDLSKLLFDSTLVLRVTSHRQFYFPRINFHDVVEIVDEKPFHYSDLPKDYIGLPLKVFVIQLRAHSNSNTITTIPINIVTSKENLILINSYRQYLLRRDSVDLSPAPGDVVLDCGSCIGDTSLIFAGLVADQGEVHSFDPIPLHTQYCQLQASLNPSLAHILHINQLAVSNCTYVTKGNKSDSDKIAPGGKLVIDSYISTRLDDYARNKLSRVDFIKMDIEGAEINAIDGAAEIIQEFKPRLAISAYHKPEDLWEIPLKLKSLNPKYEMYFEHHSPMNWESVFYAVQR